MLNQSCASTIKLVTYLNDINLFQPTGTNIVTNTAPTPGVRMRVVRDGGETASMVGLGEDLSLRIEIDQVGQENRIYRHFYVNICNHGT